MSKYLIHHGVLGQKWGIRRYQNEDGTLTAAGRKRYGYDSKRGMMSAEGAKQYIKDAGYKRNQAGLDRLQNMYFNEAQEINKRLQEKAIKKYEQMEERARKNKDPDASDKLTERYEFDSDFYIPSKAAHLAAKKVNAIIQKTHNMSLTELALRYGGSEDYYDYAKSLTRKLDYNKAWN